ncbi:MAG: hypothetical protein ACOCSI_04540 [Desulfohalobiaceae bacterium]
MYRFICVALTCVLLAFSCQAQQEQQVASPFQQKSPKEYQHSAQVRVMVHPEQIPEGDSAQELLWSRAEEAGMTRIMNHWISQRLLLEPAKGQSGFGTQNFLQSSGDLEPSQDEQTGIYTQEFVLESNFVPVEQVSGKIVNLENQHTIGGQFQHISIELQDAVPDQEGAYFLVATRAEEENQGRYRLLGGGKIHHVLGSTAQGVLMETRKEVRSGDLIFLLKTRLRPAAAEKEEQERTGLPDREQVVVEPESLEEEPEPKGSK